MFSLRRKPRFNHSCDRCQYLGTFDGYDLYFCPGKDKCFDTVLARYGNKDHKYLSGIPVAYSHSLDADYCLAPLRIAYLIAKDLGLIRS